MRKMISAVISAVMLICCLTGCGAKRDPKFVGKWEGDYMTINGKKFDDFGAEASDMFVSAIFRFELAEDGKVTWRSAIDNTVFNNANDNKDIIWKGTDENKIEIRVTDLSGKNDTQTMELSYVDGALIMGGDGSEIHLNKVDEFTEIDPYMLNSTANVIQNFGIMQ